jgi:hypothetical protein
VAEHQEFGVLGHLAPGQHRQAAQHTTDEQVDDRNDHSAMIPARQVAQAGSSNRAPQDPGADTGCAAGSKQDRHRGSGYGSDGEFLEAVSDAEGDVRDRLRGVQQLREEVTAAMDSPLAALRDARLALMAALAMATKDPCDGCHPAKAAAIAAAEAAIAAAERRISLCEAAAEILDPIAQRLQAALDCLRQVPEDLGEVYELVYEFIRKGGRLPAFALWIAGGWSAHVRAARWGMIGRHRHRAPSFTAPGTRKTMAYTPRTVEFLSSCGGHT